MTKIKRKEERLRDNIIRVLKNNCSCPEERVEKIHGSDEYGIDLVLIKIDPFGQEIAYGIQVKTGDIKSRGRNASHEIKNIIGQLCIANGKIFNIGGKNYRLESLYLVTDGSFIGKSRDYIQSAVAGIRNLHFIDGRMLTAFFVKNESKVDQFRET